MTPTPQPNAEAKTPSEPALETAPAFGWNRYAERINGRFAMVGFVALLVLELVTGQTFWSWLGLG
ncbi:MAG: chlorophyll a/b-binding protein [Nodosilinea sp.]